MLNSIRYWIAGKLMGDPFYGYTARLRKKNSQRQEITQTPENSFADVELKRLEATLMGLIETWSKKRTNSRRTKFMYSNGFKEESIIPSVERIYRFYFHNLTFDSNSYNGKGIPIFKIWVDEYCNLIKENTEKCEQEILKNLISLPLENHRSYLHYVANFILFNPLSLDYVDPNKSRYDKWLIESLCYHYYFSNTIFIEKGQTLETTLTSGIPSDFEIDFNYDENLQKIALLRSCMKESISSLTMFLNRELKVRSPNSEKIKPQLEIPKVFWKGGVADLAELIYSLEKSKSIYNKSNEPMNLTELSDFFAKTFSIKIDAKSVSDNLKKRSTTYKFRDGKNFLSQLNGNLDQYREKE